MENVIDPKELRAVVGPNVKRLRMAKGLSQAQLADVVGCREQHISRIENGAMSPSSELLFALADAFDVMADILRRPVASGKSASVA